MTIKLQDIFPIGNRSDFKIHFARRNKDGEHPLDTFTLSREQWQRWQEYRPERNDFNRDYVFSVMQFYMEQGTWLFGGIWKIKARYPDRYEVELTDLLQGFIGRLKLRHAYIERQTRVNMENYFEGFIIAEVFPEPYSGRPFTGFDNIHLSFAELKSIRKNQRIDWQSALSHMKGVYLITDTELGKRYVGSAYGADGIWSRWCNYIDSDGHGGNTELQKLVKDKGTEHCSKYFRIALLEAIPAQVSDEAVIARENFWKEVLMTRHENDFNRN
jgi:hypothetical protein